MSRRDFVQLASRIRSVPSLVAVAPVHTTLYDGQHASSVAARAVTGDYFAVTRLPIRAGREIQAADDTPTASPVVVLSERLFKSRTVGPAAIGETVRISGVPFVVVGIVADAAAGPTTLFGETELGRADAWIPLAHHPDAIDDDAPILTVFGRLPVGTPVAGVAAEVAGVAASLGGSTTPADSADAAVERVWSATTADAIARERWGALSQAGGAAVLLVGIVLLIACTNLANLSLGRSTSRIREIAIRRALGASRGGIGRELCAEPAVVAIAAGLAAFVVVRLLMWYLTMDIALTNFNMIRVQPMFDLTLFMVTAASLLGSLIVFGVVPAAVLLRSAEREGLAAGGGGLVGVRWKGRRRLIAMHVAASTVLLLLSAGAIEVATSSIQHDPGFDLSRLAIGVIDMEPIRNTPDARRAIDELARVASRQPAVDAVAVAQALPLGAGTRVRQIARLATTHLPTERRLAVAVPATPEIFETLGIPVLRGRPFDRADSTASRSVVVLSEKAARDVFGTVDVVGRQVVYIGAFDTTPTTVDVIGVARDTDTVDLGDRRWGAVYLPLVPQDAPSAIVIVRSSEAPSAIVERFDDIVRLADPRLAVEFSAPAIMAMVPSRAIVRVIAVIAGGLSLLSLALSVLGLYGVLSHVVSRRTGEIGLRLALGAGPARLLGMVVGEGMRPVLWGIATGLLMSLGARHVLQRLDDRLAIVPAHPVAFAVTAVTLLAAGLVACYLPARRASRVYPGEALRNL